VITGIPKPRGIKVAPEAQGLGVPVIEGGFPHSEILGSKLVRSSPRLIAAYHVLHRLSAPRHPPNALKTLDRSHLRCPPQFLEHTGSCRTCRGDAVLRDPHHGIKAILKTSLLRMSFDDGAVTLRRPDPDSPKAKGPDPLFSRSNECFFTMSDNTHHPRLRRQDVRIQVSHGREIE
jgi:hypothetical protein